ncbi:MAG: recombinase family protein [Sciscionella sp.]
MASTSSTPPTDTRPAVYGYLRTDDTDEDIVSGLRTGLRIFCAARDWRLVTVFCDRDSDGSETARPGFAGALDVLALPASTTLVVPSLEHLSPEEAVRAALASMVRRAGATVVVAEALNGKPTSTTDTSR